MRRVVWRLLAVAWDRTFNVLRGFASVRPPVLLFEAPCAECGGMFVSRRMERRFCGALCRKTEWYRLHPRATMASVAVEYAGLFPAARVRGAV